MLIFPFWGPAMSWAECITPLHALGMNTAGCSHQHKQETTPLPTPAEIEAEKHCKDFNSIDGWFFPHQPFLWPFLFANNLHLFLVLIFLNLNPNMIFLVSLLTTSHPYLLLVLLCGHYSASQKSSQHPCSCICGVWLPLTELLFNNPCNPSTPASSCYIICYFHDFLCHVQCFFYVQP